MGGPDAVMGASLVTRLVRGTRRHWVAEAYRDALPDDLAETVMDLPATDRHHEKQGRSTARVRFDSAGGPLSVYLKRHRELPWTARVAATLMPSGAFSPGWAEREHLLRARALGIAVPEIVAAGETIGPWGRLQSFLMVAELTGSTALHEAMPELVRSLTKDELARAKRQIVVEMAGIVARLHQHGLFHKDLYLCHFFLAAKPATGGGRLTLIDLHRLGHHRLAAFRWRWKDLGQLLFSTFEVPGIEDRDRLRFWKHYRRAMALRWEGLERRAVQAKARRYWNHNQRG